ncbi:hypothetical protein ACIO3S_01545 [Nocardioides sp. NPDC087217]|uniref:hypothetical protein n=1 Tax=Nocardioides sp. NPDC087217 TaxID=3364335 RepID=UPI003821F556
MRARLLVLAAALLLPLGLLTMASQPAQAASGISVNLAEIKQSNAAMTSKYSYLSSHRTWTAWKPRIAPVSNEISDVQQAIGSGQAAQTVASARSAFVTYARAHRYAKALSVLRKLIAAVNRMIDSHDRADWCATHWC